MRVIITLTAIILIIQCACHKDELTQPVPVVFTFTMNDSVSRKAKDQLTFHEGEMNIAQVSFEGYREFGQDIFFDSDFPGIVHADLKSEISDPPIVFDIPQGVYEHINLRMKIDSLGTGLSLKIVGSYASPKPPNDVFEVIFIYELPDIIDLDPKPGTNLESIVFTPEKENEIRIVLDTKFLFLLLNTSMLESADKIIEGEKKYIFISSKINENIYHVISNRIDKSIQAWAY